MEKPLVELSPRAQKIHDLIKKHKISGYKIENDTSLSSQTFYNFMNRKFAPHYTTLDILENYLTENYEPIDKVVMEEREDFNAKNPEEDVKDIVIRLEEKIDALKLQQEIMFEIIKNSKKIEWDFIEKETEKKLSNS